MQERLIFDGQDFAKLILDKIAAAKNSILISTYIFESDEFGESVVKSLEASALRGVTVSLLVDGLGSRKWIETCCRTRFPALAVRIFHPLPWPLGRFVLTWGQSFYFLYRANRRNHQKLAVFDGQTAILGSRNIHGEALRWRETSLLIERPEVSKTLSEIFWQIWSISHGTNLRRALGSRLQRFKSLGDTRPVHSTHSHRLRREWSASLMGKIRNSTSRVIIITPYFLPPNRLLRLLKRKIGRGVQVSVLVPLVTDVWISKVLARSLLNELSLAGARVFRYESHVLHAKTIIVDDWAILGSSNLNQRSALHDLELDIELENPNTVQQLVQRWHDDVGQSSKYVYENQPLGLALLSWLLRRLIPTWF